MSPSRLWPALAVLLPAVSSLLAPMSTVDLTYQLRAGRLMLDTRALLTVDSFTFTVAGQPWLDQQWLAQLVLAGSHELGSWAGLALLRAVLIGVIAAGVLIACRAGGLGPRTASLLALLAYVVALPALALRPQLLGIACFAVVLALLAVRRDRRAVVWLVVPVAVLWANVHGSFLLAPAAVGFALLTDLAARRGGLRRLFVLLMATVVATCITPWGPSVWTYAIDLARDPRLRELVTEWQPPELLSFVGIALAVSGFLAILIVVRAGRRSDWPTVLWLFGLALLAVMTQRGIPWWAVGAPVALAPILARIIPASSSAGASASATGGRVDRIFGIAIPGVVVLAGLAMLVPWIGADPVLGPPGKLTDAPPGVTAAVLAQGNPGDRLFAAQRWGSWFEWVAPEKPVFVDSRVELFPPSVWDEFLAVSRGDTGWQAILDRWDVAIVAVSRTEQEGLVRAIAADPGWRVVSDTPDGLVVVRS